mgnify:CR=1 FL=1
MIQNFEIIGLFRLKDFEIFGCLIENILRLVVIFQFLHC